MASAEGRAGSAALTLVQRCLLGDASDVAAILDCHHAPEAARLADESDVEGWTPLYAAAIRKKGSAVAVLLKYGADVNKRNPQSGDSPLYASALVGDEDVVSQLIEAGVSLDHKNRGGSSPLYIACQEGHVGVANLLVKAGAGLESKVRYHSPAARAARGEKVPGYRPVEAQPTAVSARGEAYARAPADAEALTRAAAGLSLDEATATPPDRPTLVSLAAKRLAPQPKHRALGRTPMHAAAWAAGGW